MSDAAPQKLGYGAEYSLADLKELLEKYFEVIDGFLDLSGIPTFTINPEPVKNKFKSLTVQFNSIGLLPIMRRSESKFVVKIFNKPPQKPGRKGLGLILFVATMITIYLAGYVLWIENPLWSEILMPKANPFLQAGIYAVCLAGIIGIHELGHKIACSRHGLMASKPYFIPGFPPFGTFGALISLKDPPTNKDELFDIGVSGPIAGFCIVILVTLISVALGVVIPDKQAQILQEQNLIGALVWPNSPYLFEMLSGLVETLNLMVIPQGSTLVLANILFAAWVGCLITFLNLLPIWQLDGGHISRAVLGLKGHRFATIAGLGVLIVSGYWFFALFLVFLMSASRRMPEAAEPLENISELSMYRKAFYLVILLILVLCFVTPPS
ncbi:site-2 protease family protein [[Eubacterium] cellulosolvens]